MGYVSLFRLSAIRGQNASGFSSIDVGADYCQVVACGFESLIGIAVRDESGVVIKHHISLPPETVEDG